MKCPKCKKTINLGEQMLGWDKNYGCEALLDPSHPSMVNIFCRDCGISVAVVWIEATEEVETIKNYKGDPVEIPISKSTKTKKK